MCDDNIDERAWRLYVDDMVRFANKSRSYTEDMDKADFIANELVYDATLRNLSLIGEAASKIPFDVREQYPNVPWRLIIATRNRLIHAYLGIDNDIVWSIIQDQLPCDYYPLCARWMGKRLNNENPCGGTSNWQRVR